MPDCWGPVFIRHVGHEIIIPIQFKISFLYFYRQESLFTSCFSLLSVGPHLEEFSLISSSLIKIFKLWEDPRGPYCQNYSAVFVLQFNLYSLHQYIIYSWKGQVLKIVEARSKVGPSQSSLITWHLQNTWCENCHLRWCPLWITFCRFLHSKSKETQEDLILSALSEAISSLGCWRNSSNGSMWIR